MMFQKDQKLWLIDGQKIITCLFVCDVVDIDGRQTSKYAVEIKTGTITTLYFCEIYKTERLAITGLISKINEVIGIKRKKIETLKEEIK